MLCIFAKLGRRYRQAPVTQVASVEHRVVVLFRSREVVSALTNLPRRTQYKAVLLLLLLLQVLDDLEG